MWIALFIIGIIVAIRKKWKKQIKIFILIFAVVIFKIGFAQNDFFTVQGKLILPEKDGFVYVYLVDEKQFNIPFTGIDTLKYRADKTEISFCFKNVKIGKYAIRCFQDKNGNKKLDKGLFGPTEPYGFSWRNKKKFPLDFEDIVFFVNKNKYIKITLN